MLSLFIVALSCQKDDVEPSLTISDPQISISNAASTKSISFTANMGWSAKSSASWCTLSKTSGDASNTSFGVTVDANDTYNDRTATITIMVGNLSKSVAIKQGANSGLIVSPDKFDLSNDATTIEVTVEHNVDFDITISDEWITSDKSRALTSDKIYFNIAKNDSYDNRNGSITIKQKDGALETTIKVFQSQENAIIISDKTEEVTSEEQVLEVALKTNVDFEVIIPSDARSWVSYTATRALRDETIILNIAKNESETDSRTTEVYVENSTTEVRDTLTIIQAYAINDTVVAPVINPSGGKYAEAQTISMTSATEGAEIRYTLDGSDPSDTSELYTGDFVIEDNITIKAIAYKTDWMASPITTEVYEIIPDAEIIVGTSNTIQHIENTKDFVFQLNELDDKEVYFVFSNKDERRPVNLPQLESNISPLSNTNARRSLSAINQSSSFNISGKPSVTKFNNSSHDKLKRGKLSPQYKQQMKVESENLEVGTSEDLYDSDGKVVTSTVRKAVSAQGKNLYVWVADNCWGEQSKKRHSVTQQMVDEFAPKFLNSGSDNDIYEWVTNAAGDPWGPTSFDNLIDETDDIHIWLMDIDDDNATSGKLTLGYYYARDNYIKSTYPASNEKLMFTIDAVLFSKPSGSSWSITDYWPKELISTLAHEFTHMIYFYQKNILADQNSNTAINEMSAQCMEDLVANKIESDGPRGVPYATPSAGAANNKNGRIPLYNKYNDYTLLDWSRHPEESLINYSKTYTLGAYLMRNYGGANFIRELIQNEATGANSIVQAVNSNGGAVSNYGDVLQRFAATNLLSDQAVLDAGYIFNTDDWSTSTVNGISYTLGAINLFNYSPAPYIYDKLPKQQKPGSNLFYKAGSNLSGDVEWYFNEISNNTLVTVIIK